MAHATEPLVDGYDIPETEPVPVREISRSPAEAHSSHFTSIEPSPTVDLNREWTSFLDYLMKDRPNLGSFLSFASLVGVSDSAVDLRFPSSMRFQYSQVTRKDSRAEIIRHLHNFAGKQFEIRITIEKEKEGEGAATGVSIASQPKVDKVTLQDEIDKEPIIETVLDFFDGEIID